MSWHSQVDGVQAESDGVVWCMNCVTLKFIRVAFIVGRTGGAMSSLCNYGHTFKAVVPKCLWQHGHMPESAAVQAESDGVVWCMDRVTFRSTIVASTAVKWRCYEQPTHSWS